MYLSPSHPLLLHQSQSSPQLSSKTPACSPHHTCVPVGYWLECLSPISARWQPHHTSRSAQNILTTPSPTKYKGLQKAPGECILHTHTHTHLCMDFKTLCTKVNICFNYIFHKLGGPLEPTLSSAGGTAPSALIGLTYLFQLP